jgi:SAM-dependent methyltransferase
VDLAPWHLDVEIRPGLTTAAGVSGDNEGVSFVDDRPRFRSFIQDHVGSLEDKRFLDCACNCGAYSFWARELGAAECFGFDVRKHWIRQARFLAVARRETDCHFKRCDLYELPRLEPFDVTLFKGIFYHLPDPIDGLKIAAELTQETLIVNTAMRIGEPDGRLVQWGSSAEHPMQGVHELGWYPTGPRAVVPILRWLGFTDIRETYRDESNGPVGRLELVATR